jgi:heme-degrading monooxygenase HmoA
VVVEIAMLEINPGAEDAFVAAYGQVRHEVASTPGCRSMRLTRGIESPSRFVLLVEWDSVEAHEQTFRGSPRFDRWRAGIGPFFARPPEVEHYSDTAGD